MMTSIGEESAEAEVKVKDTVEDVEPTIDLSGVSKKLADGLMSIYQKPLEHVKEELNELTSKQELCIFQMELENKKISNFQEDIELNDMFATMEIYQEKLVSIKREIMIIHDRTTKLKKKALRLQQMKQKEQKEHQHMQELQKEERLLSSRSENA